MSSLSPQEKLFQTYCDMGPGRGHKKLQELVSADPKAYGLQSAPSLRMIRAWSSEGKWSDRIHRPEFYELEVAEKRLLERIEDHLERQRKSGLELQERGMELLRGAPGNGVKVNDAVATVVTGLGLEALSLRSAAGQKPQLALGEEELERLTDYDKSALLRLLQKAIGELPPKPSRPPKKTKLLGEIDFDKLWSLPRLRREDYLRGQREIRRRGW